MIVTHKIKMDLVWREVTPCIDVVQDDKYSRNIQLELYENGRRLEVSKDCKVMVHYKNPDGTGGAYDTMPDGTLAWSIEENSVTIRVAPQVCTAVGTVTLTVTLLQDEQELSCFAIGLRVQEFTRARMRSDTYVNVSAFLPQAEHAVAGQVLQIEAVNSQGKVIKLRSVPVAQSEPDWRAMPGEEGHVRNRTHYDEGTADIPFLPEMVVALDEGGLCYHLGALPFAEGKTYLIVLNGVEYATVCRHILIDEEEEEYGLLIGNPLVLEMEDDGCPIALAAVPGYSVTIIAPVYEDQSVEGHTLAVYERQDVVHKLDSKYVDAAWMAQKTVTETEILGKTGLMNVVLPKIYEQTRYLDKVRVVFDGVSYECAVFHFDDTDIFGNLNAMTGGEAFAPSGEPFFAVVDAGSTFVNPLDENLESHTIAIYGVHETISRMPEEFLPEGYGRDELVAAVIDALPDAEGVSF